MKKINLFASITAVLFGCFIMAVSFIAANQVVSYEGVNASNKKLYFGQVILPDHVLYPAVAAADRLVLMAAPPSDKIELQLAYGEIRLDYARGLLEKGEFEMAQAALTKSQKYHSLAAHQLLKTKSNSHLKQEVVRQLALNLDAVEELLPQLAPSQQQLANQLQHQNRALLQKLQEL